MKTILAALFALLLSACATAQTVTTDAKPSGVVGLLIQDFGQAAKDYRDAAATQTPGSALAVDFTAKANCMDNYVVQFQSAANAAGVPAGAVVGIVSGGAVVDIRLALLRAEAQAAQDAAAKGTTACDQAAGSMLRAVGTTGFQVLGPAVVRKILGLP